MVVNPILIGMLGLETLARYNMAKLTPHFPANWRTLSAHNIRTGSCLFDLTWARNPGVTTLVVQAKPTTDVVGKGQELCDLIFNPAFSTRARVTRATLDGKEVQFQLKPSANDQHALAEFKFGYTPRTLQFSVQNDFAVSYDSSLPSLGSASRDLHILSETWSPSHDRLTINLSGIAGEQYFIDVSDVQQITSIDGGELLKTDSFLGRIHVRMPDGAPNTFINSAVTIKFVEKHRGAKNSKP